MAHIHDRWYTRLFSNPGVVEDLLRSFVDEKFVKDLDYSSLKKLNTKFVPVSEKARQADVIYEVKSRGQTAYIYLFIEFQTSVDRFMALRMARYLFEFYQEFVELKKPQILPPAFPILIYNGKDRWKAPTSFRDLLQKSSIPAKYLPQFTYFKIAVNEFPKRELVKIRNAAAAAFYVENSSPEDIALHRRELVALLTDVFKKEGAAVVRAIVDRISRTQKLPIKSKSIETIETLMEVSTMWEENVKEYWAAKEAETEVGAKQETLIDQIEIRYGMTQQSRRKIQRTTDLKKLRAALKAFAIATTRREVLKCLD